MQPVELKQSGVDAVTSLAFAEYCYGKLFKPAIGPENFVIPLCCSWRAMTRVLPILS